MLKERDNMIWYPERCPYPGHSVEFCDKCHHEEPGPAPCDATVEDLD
jgi:hypothetical protein